MERPAIPSLAKVPRPVVAASALVLVIATATILAALAFEHLGGSSESDRSTLLLDGKSCEEDRNEAILAERNPEVGMPGDLKCELAIPPFIRQLFFRQRPDWQPAQDEGLRAETEVLCPLLALDADQFDTVGLPDLLFRDNQVAMSTRQDDAGAFKTRTGPRCG